MSVSNSYSLFGGDGQAGDSIQFDEDSSKFDSPVVIAGDSGKSAGGVIAQVFGSIFSSIFSLLNQNSVNLQNQRLAREQNRFNLEQWYRELSYNSPYAQKMRLIQAGLNPGLMYGDGGISNLAPQSPEMVSSQGRATAQFANPFSNFMNDVKTAELLQAQKENIEADTMEKRSQAGLNDVNIQLSNLNLEIKQEYAKDLTEAQLRQINTSCDKMNAEIKQIFENIDFIKLKEEDLFYKINNLNPAELDKIKSQTNLNDAQAKEILKCLSLKMQLLSAQARYYSASADNQSAMAELNGLNARLQRYLQNQPEWLLALTDSLSFDNSLKGVKINYGVLQSNILGGSTTFSGVDYGDFTPEQIMQAVSGAFSIMGQLFRGVGRASFE